MYLFSDGAELKKVSSSQELIYMKLMKSIFTKFGAWPLKEFGEEQTKYYRVRTLLTFAAQTVIIPSEIVYLKENQGKLSLFEIGHSYITTLMTMTAAARIAVFMFQSYLKTVTDFIKSIHLFNHEAKSEYAKMVHLKIHKICHFFAMHLMTTSILGCTLFNMIPLSTNVLSGAFKMDKPDNLTFEHSVYYSFPFDYVYHYPGYIVVFIFNVYISISCTCAFINVDCLMSTMVFHLWGHLTILIYDLENFPRPTTSIGEGDTKMLWYTKEENERVFKTLKSYIVYHRLITNFASQMSSIFGPVLIINYAFHQISGCILWLECSLLEANALARYLPLTIILNEQLIQLSVVFELLKSKSDLLPDAVYSVPWEYMDSRNRKLVYILLYQSQKSISVKALDMVSVGVQSMASVLKTSFSYFVMLRTLADDD